MHNTVLTNAFPFSPILFETWLSHTFQHKLNCSICSTTVPYTIFWYWYKMVTQNSLRTHEVNQVISEKKPRIWRRFFRCNQMPSTNWNTCFTPYVRTVFWATILYKYYDTIYSHVSLPYPHNCKERSISMNNSVIHSVSSSRQ